MTQYTVRGTQTPVRVVFIKAHMTYLSAWRVLRSDNRLISVPVRVIVFGSLQQYNTFSVLLFLSIELF